MAGKAIQQTKGERTAERILAVALDLFSRLGFDRVTTADIARAAGIAQSAVHYHFRDKDELWRAALLAMKDDLAGEERLMSAAAAELDALAKLKLSMRLFLRATVEQPALGRIVMLEGMAGGPRLAWMVEVLMAPRYARLVEITRAAIADGSLKPFPPEQIVIALHAAAATFFTLGPLMREAFGIDVTDPDRQAAQEALVMEAVFAGLTNR